MFRMEHFDPTFAIHAFLLKNSLFLRFFEDKAQ